MRCGTAVDAWRYFERAAGRVMQKRDVVSVVSRPLPEANSWTYSPTCYEKPGMLYCVPGAVGAIRKVRIGLWTCIACFWVVGLRCGI